MTDNVRDLIDRAVDRFCEGMQEVIDVAGRLSLLEEKGGAASDSIKYLRQALSDVRSGTQSAPGLHQVQMTNQELTMEVRRLKENDKEITDNLKSLAQVVGDLKSQAQVAAWKIGVILAVLVFVANRIAEAVKFP